MKILVTGSAGFLGQYLVPSLKKLGHQVIGVDIQKETLSDIFIQQDLRFGIPDMPQIDICVHLASSVGGFLHNSQELSQEKYELDLLKSVYDFSQKNPFRRIIYTSSINVFERAPAYEHGPLRHHNQVTPYARAKKEGELFVQEHFREFTIVRPTNIFGKKQSLKNSASIGSSHVIPELLRKIDASDRVEVLGDGSQVRNFIHASDVCLFLTSLLNHPKNGWYNLRSDNQLSIRDLVQELLAFRGVKRDIVYRPQFLKYEPRPIYPFGLEDLTSMGWHPHITSIREGLNHEP